jgi:hypothetical protein
LIIVRLVRSCLLARLVAINTLGFLAALVKHRFCVSTRLNCAFKH